jgi:outer membrane protein OmpA-like peptidoglycan-associated protein
LEGYISASREITLKKGKVTRVNFLLSPASIIPSGGLSLEEVTLLRIQFAFGKAVLTKEAKSDLDKLALTLKHHPNLSIDIRSLLPETKKEESQTDLTKKRIEAVRNYLVSKGISTDRLSP